MNKSQLVEAIAHQTDINKKQAAATLDAITSTITSSLASGEEVSLVGFGTFKVSDRAARAGRNPQTGEAIQIKASRVPSWKPGKTVKDSVNGH
jgi:DNA-binding protein HU-beta